MSAKPTPTPEAESSRLRIHDGSNPCASFQPWCCGTLQTGSIAVGFTHLVCILLLFLWLVQILLDSHHAFIGVIVAVIIVFALSVVNIGLIYGAQHRQRSLVAPWLVIYLLFQIGLLVALPLTWSTLGPLRAVTIATLIVICYCYTVVTFYFNELKEEGEDEEGDDDVELATTKEKRRSNGALIVLEEEENNIGTNDDTFTQLMYRKDKAKGTNDEDGDDASGSFAVPLSDNNPFASMLQASSGDGGGGERFKASFLPKPEEVIQVSQEKEPLPEEAVGLLGGDEDEEEETPFSNTKLLLDASSTSPSKGTQLQLRRQRSAADASTGAASASLSGGATRSSACDITDGSHCNGLQRRSRGSSTGLEAAGESRTASHSGLVDIDSSFTPFKKKGSSTSDGTALPKMKIFLPHQGDTSSENDEDSSSGEEEEETTVPT